MPVDPSRLPPFPILETPRLVLRDLRLPDAPHLLAFFGDEWVAGFLDGPLLTEVEEAEEIIEWAADMRAKRFGIRWGITLKGQDRVIGTCGFHRWDKTHHRAETGYELARDHWRQGIMSEALRAIFGYGFGAMGLHRIEALVDPHNDASLGLLRALGFTEEGTLRDYQYYLSMYHDLKLLSLLQGEWASDRGRDQGKSC